MANFDKNIPNEIIVLSHLQYLYDNNLDNSSFHFPGSHLKIKKESTKKYVKIDAKKVKELVNKFITYKLKAVFSGKILTIDNTRIFELPSSLYESVVNVYENNYINKLFKLYLEDDDSHYIIRKTEMSRKILCKGDVKVNIYKDILSVIGLDNHDLILQWVKKKESWENKNMVEEHDDNISKEYKLFIYRLEDKHYFLFQKFDLEEYIYIEKLSGNRFFSISNSIVKLYSLSEYNEYSVVKDFSISNVIQFCEINENQFIFCCKGYDDDDYNLFIDEFFGYSHKKKYTMSLTQTPSFKIFYCDKLLFEYKDKNIKKVKFSDLIVLKNKYGIIMIDNNLLIINVLEEKIIKRYTILYYDDNDNFIISKDYLIKKWNNINDNEFILIINGNITLFELNDKSGINLEILAYYYFQNINNDLKKIDENNRFYIKKKDENYNNNIYFY